MTTFKIGDKIRSRSGKVGVVVECPPNWRSHQDNLNRAGIEHIWAKWEGFIGDGIAWTKSATTTLIYTELQYDPTQAGDREDDV